jgi:hypothetical protein
MTDFHQGIVVGLAAAIASSVCVISMARPDNPPQPPSLAEAATRLEKRVDALEKLTPGPGMIMTSVQVHFSKLYYAVQYVNWDLAAFELGQVIEQLQQAAIARPVESGVNLASLVDAIKSGPLAKIKSEVIDKKDKTAFDATYTEAVNLCNGCHQQTGRAFIRVVIPYAPPVHSQDWNPPQK